MSTKNQPKSNQQSEPTPPEPVPDIPEATKGTGATGIRLSRHRLKAAELATQLVAAQIAASASYQAALEVAAEQRDMVGELMGLLPLMLPPACDRPDATIMAGLQTRLTQVRIRVRKPLVLDPLGNQDFDHLFTSAMLRAQQLLAEPKDDHSVIWAEQLFKPDEVLVENQIHDRFKKFKWPNLTGTKSVRTLMDQINNYFRLEYGILSDTNREQSPELASGREDMNQLRRALAACERMAARENHNYYRNDFEACIIAISEVLHLKPNRIRRSRRTPIDQFRNVLLIHHMYDSGPIPGPRNREATGTGTATPATGDPSGAAGGSTGRGATRYYPWALFRYIRLHSVPRPVGLVHDGDNIDLGSGLREKLQVTARDLNHELVSGIAALHPDSYGFGHVGMLADYELEGQ